MGGKCLFALLAAVFSACAGSAAAHPLGNFSVSQYSALRVGAAEIELRYIVDLAEIPTFQEIQDSGLVAKFDDPSAQLYAARKAETLRNGLSLEINRRPVALRVASQEIIFPEGAGGLPTLKLGVLYKGEFSGAETLTVEYHDNNFPGRAGWKEMIAVAGTGAKLVHSSVPERDRSVQLTNYPTDLLDSPPQVLAARIEFATTPVAIKVTDGAPKQVMAPAPSPSVKASSAASAAPVVADVAPAKAPVQLRANQQSTPNNSFTELITAKQLDWRMILVAFLIAASLGAFHALEPGHGKTLVAAYLVGSRGTMKHALWLGLIVTATHTAGVYLLGAVTLYASRYIVPERLYPWLGVISGVTISALGSILLLRRYLGKYEDRTHHHHGHSHSHGHHHDHDHGDHHHHGQSHHHDDEKQEVSLQQLLALGVSGGIVPCPAALVVLLSAVSMQRIGFGLMLIVAFSIGLAAVLISIGLLMVYARQFMARFQSESRVITHWLPLTSSAFILIAGLALTFQALQSTGLFSQL